MSSSITIRQINDVSILDVKNRITLGEGSSALRETLREMVNAGLTRIVVNLEGASYIDSSGLGVLVGGFASITRQGGQLKLLNLNKRVRDLLLITKLFTVFEVFEDETVALRSFTTLQATV